MGMTETIMKSLLFLNPTKDRYNEIKANLSAQNDLNINKITDRIVMKYLSLRCTTDEIRARQQIFRALETDSFKNGMHMVKEKINLLSAASIAYTNSSNEVERIFNAKRLCLAYIDASRTILKIEKGFLLTDRLVSDIENKSANIKAIEKAEADSRAAFKTVTDFRLTFDYETKVTKNNIHIESMAVRLRKSAYELDFGDGTAKREMSLGVSEQLSAALLRLYPDEMRELSVFKDKLVALVDAELLIFEEELNFYFGILELCERAKEHGINITIPELTDEKQFIAESAYDATLIYKNEYNIVPNGLFFYPDKGVYFLTGANGGGKTTYLRSAAVNLIFALTGCPVFGKGIKFWAFDGVFAHFPSDERFTDSGRLLEEKKRVDEILAKTTSRSFVFLNETFSGTDGVKGTALAIETAKTLAEKGAFLLYITHFHEVADSELPMLHTEIDAGCANKRTYKIVPGDGSRRSYAADILKKYNLTKQKLIERFGDRSEA
ncbi:MAG: hypothetical protein PHY15_03670 [Eubacteriales bacterium]|nr:hypothetical protein [Eubacteriales bacterium]